MPVVSAFDLIGIQQFVFASNRLRDVVGASHLVDWATSADQARSGLIRELAAPEVLLAAGGNAIVRFDGSDPARDFAARYTSQLHQCAPGLEAAVAHREYGEGGLAQALAALQVGLARAKLEHRPSSGHLGLGVTAVCRQTGWVAAGLSERAGPTVPVSATVAAVRHERVLNRAAARWACFLPAELPPSIHQPLAFPDEIDQMGRELGERSLMGVVHVDGDRVGERITRWLNEAGGQPDAAVSAEHQEWSQALRDVVEDALMRVVKRVADALDPRARAVYVAGSVPDLDFPLRTSEDGKLFLPLRPVLLGGDDLTFVCDGRIALDLAATAVAAFADADVPHLGRLTASAGVALVRTHSPFVRAYELASDLCRSAKDGSRAAEKNQRPWAHGGLDWHIGSTRPGEKVNALRKRQYAGGLTCRPYPLGDSAGEVGSWRWLAAELLGTPRGPETSLRGPVWGERRAKALRLAAAARDGTTEVERALRTWNVTTTEALQLPQAMRDGFFDGRSPLLDAVELLDRSNDLGACP